MAEKKIIKIYLLKKRLLGAFFVIWYNFIMKKIKLKENKKMERFKCDNSKMMQLAINSKNYHKKKLEEKLLIQLNNLNNTLNKNKILELIEIAGDSRKYLVRNFMSGISKGIGIGIGFSIITALIVYVMQKIIRLNIPVLSQYISDIVEIVERTK